MANRVLTLVAAAALVLGVSGPAPAQTTTMPTFELSAGYQLLRAGEVCGEDGENGETEDCGSAQTFPFGVAVDAARNFGAVGIVGEAGWSRDSEDIPIIGEDDESVDVDALHVAAGVRWTGRTNPRIWPYGQVLAGALVTRVSESIFGESDTFARFMLQPGVGVNFVAGDGWGIVTQVDYRRVFLDEDEDGATGRNDVRVFIGARMILD